MKTIAVIFLTASLLVSISAGQTTRRPVAITDRLLGNWVGEGTFSRAESKVWATFESVLEGQFIRLSVKVESKSADSKPRIFAGNAYYQFKGANAYEGHWFDSEGHQYPIKSTQDADSLTTLWGIPGQVNGKSVYRISDGDKILEIVDSFQQKDGIWKELNRYRLRRS